jgi:hypothetical protein
MTGKFLKVQKDSWSWIAFEKAVHCKEWDNKSHSIPSRIVNVTEIVIKVENDSLDQYYVYDDRPVPTVYAQITIEKGDKNGKALDTNINIS